VADQSDIRCRSRATAFLGGLDALAEIPCTAYPITELVDIQLAAGLVATECAAGKMR